MSFDLAKVLATIRQPGAAKGLIGVSLAFIGTQLAQDALGDTEERRQAAAAELDMIEGSIREGTAALVALIERGELDSHVLARADMLGWTPPAEPDPEPDDQADDDPPYYQADTVGERLANHRPGGGEPNADLPERTPGAYLAGINPSAADMLADAEVPRATADAD